MICNIFDQYMNIFCDSSAFWSCSLSNGEVVYQDDFRQFDNYGNSITEPYAWNRLNKYIQDSGLSLSKIEVCFKGSRLTVFEDMENYDGWYFARGAAGVMNAGITHNLYVFGVYKDGVMHLRKVSVPYIKLYEVCSRDLCKFSQGLIKNPNVKEKV